jgi:hypothetical protein
VRPEQVPPRGGKPSGARQDNHKQQSGKRQNGEKRPNNGTRYTKSQKSTPKKAITAQKAAQKHSKKKK